MWLDNASEVDILFYEPYAKDQQKIDNLLTIWEKSGIIDKESIKTIKEKGK